MNIADLKASLDYLTKAELTPFIWGHAGVGKTTSVKQWAESHGYQFFAFYLGTQSDSGDILGLYEFVRNSEGKAESVDYAIPQWLFNAITYCNENPDSGAVIFLDEFNRGRRDIMQGMFSFALDKKFHTIQLPKNCYIIAAGNPPTDEYFTTDVDDTALMARFVHIKLEPTFSEWVDYAKTRNFEQTLIGFIQEQPQLLEEVRTEFKLPVKVDRRAFERLNRLFAIRTPSNLLEQLMFGIIGLERTVAYQQYLKESDKPLTGIEILCNSKWTLVEKWCAPENVAASFLNLSCDNLIEEITKLNTLSQNLNKTEKSNLMTFLSTIPKDISFPLIKKLVQNGNSVFKDFYMDPLYEVQMQDLVKSARGKNG
jgi:AAA domain (dynein-related subfamily)